MSSRVNDIGPTFRVSLSHLYGLLTLEKKREAKILMAQGDQASRRGLKGRLVLPGFEVIEAPNRAYIF
jgi:hypothetical protein